MSPTLKRVLSVTAIVLSGLVIILCAAGVIGIWAASGKIIDTGTKLISGAEKVANATQIGLKSIDRELSNLETDTATIQEATAQLSQNIADKGLILVLLPPAREEKLTNSIDSIKDALTTAEQMVSSLIDTLTFIDSMPFVDIPKPDPDSLQAMAVKVGELNASIDNTKALIQQARDNSAGASQKVSDSVAVINTKIKETRAEAQSRSEQVAGIQDSLASIKESLPTSVYVGALIITLILAWVIYTQVLIIQFALAKYKSA